MGLVFLQLPVGNFKNFCYIIGDDVSCEAAVVDPAWEVRKIASELKARGLRLKYIINTHHHRDHTNGNDELKALLGGELVAHSKSPLPKDLPVEDGFLLKVGEVEIRVLHTPGHTPDSICLLVEGRKLLTGDTLFVGDCGRTDLPGGDPGQMYDTLFGKLLKLGDDIEVYPGHDYGPTPSSTLGRERMTNYTLQPRSKEEFIRFMAQP